MAGGLRTSTLSTVSQMSCGWRGDVGVNYGRLGQQRLPSRVGSLLCPQSAPLRLGADYMFSTPFHVKGSPLINRMNAAPLCSMLLFIRIPYLALLSSLSCGLGSTSTSGAVEAETAQPWEDVERDTEKLRPATDRRIVSPPTWSKNATLDASTDVYASPSEQAKHTRRQQLESIRSSCTHYC